MRTPIHQAAVRSALSRRTWRRGGSLLEAAIVVPILLSLTFGAIEFGDYFFVKHTLNAAAREGARNGIVDTATNTTVQTAVTSVLTASGGTNWGATTTITDTSGNSVNVATVTAGNPVEVTVTATWGVCGLRPMQLISSSKLVSGSCVMRKES
jgi:Flp pilus assembly protein TadG